MKARIDFPGTDGQRLRLEFSNPVEVLIAHRLDEVAAVIAEAERQARAGRWVAGFVAYEAAPAFDAAMKVRPPAGALPLAAFAVCDAPSPQPLPREGGGAFSCGSWRMATPRERAMETIAGIRRRIAAGDFYQVNLTTRLRAGFEGDGRALFEALRETQPDGYCIHLQDADWEILSVSPELFFDWRPGGVLTTRPMKGTAPRHADAAADAGAARAMHDSAKEQAENLMIVDLLRNDLSRIAGTGTVRVPRLFEVEALPTAWQMTSTVQCETRAGTGLADVFGALFPCGSVTGAPKVAAMAAIAELEPSPRGAYCGAIGLIRPGGHATFNVGIRTVTLDRRAMPGKDMAAFAQGRPKQTRHAPKAQTTRSTFGDTLIFERSELSGTPREGGEGGRAICGVGSGIVFDSDARDEFGEWLVKRRFLLRASASFELLETIALQDGRYLLEERHLARLAASAAHFGFGFDPARVESTLAELAAQHPQGAWRVRLLLDRHGRARAECFALEPTPPDVAVALVTLAATPIAGDLEFLLHKTTQRDAYLPFAPSAGTFDTLLWNECAELTEFTRGNLVVELDGQLVTPPVACGLLPGVLRAELLARGELTERTLRVDELPRAAGIWFINSVRGRVKVRLI